MHDIYNGIYKLVWEEEEEVEEEELFSQGLVVD